MVEFIAVSAGVQKFSHQHFRLGILAYGRGFLIVFNGAYKVASLSSRTTRSGYSLIFYCLFVFMIAAQFARLSGHRRFPLVSKAR